MLPISELPPLCDLCGLTREGTGICVNCSKVACVNCSLPAIKLDKDGTMLTEVVPNFVEILCSDCTRPGGGSTSRLRNPIHPVPGFGIFPNQEVPCYAF